MSYNVGDWIWASQATQTINTTSVTKMIDTFSNGDSIIVGYFFGSTTFDNITLSSTNTEHGFVAKIDSSGNWIWAKQVSNTSSCTIACLKTRDDYAIISGNYQGDIDFDEITLTGNSSSFNTFIAKIDSSGNWVWVTSATSTTDNYSNALEITNDESIICVGNFDTEITFGDITIDDSGSNYYFNGYITKLDSSGNNWIWAKKITCSDYMGIYTIKLLSNEDFVIGGEFYPDAVFDDITLTSTDYNTFIGKLDSSGNWLSVITFDDNHSSSNWCTSLTVLSDDSIIITGSFNDSITFGDITLENLNIYYDIYVIKLDASNNWIWGISVSGENTSLYGTSVFDIKSLPSGSAIIGGRFDTLITFGEITLTSLNDNIFVAKIDKSGNWLWAYCPTILTDNTGGPYQNMIFSINIYDNNLLVTGTIRDNASFGNNTITTNYNAAYVAKMYIGPDIDNNIPNELASVEEKVKNSIIDNKNAVIKELYDIHNLKKFKLNYILKNIINKSENTNDDIDPTTNLINLYYK